MPGCSLTAPFLSLGETLSSDAKCSVFPPQRTRKKTTPALSWQIREHEERISEAVPFANAFGMFLNETYGSSGLLKSSKLSGKKKR